MRGNELKIIEKKMKCMAQQKLSVMIAEIRIKKFC